MPMQIVDVLPKMRKFRGKPYSMDTIVGKADMQAHIERNKSIRLVGQYSNRDIDITFKVGDTAEYDSYNLSYLGTITKITDKCVTIDPKYGERHRRLDLHTFMWRNHSFDLAAIEKSNMETSYSI